ncbi:GH25 family lysozyme [Luteimonas sp. FCS-9]|uniref:GH25 family lysozyme n=1 Tax=Luteimonas sp. FCS-9 TaxID=1547516 RepID=UPI00063E7EFE|nr:GH25 family lysozyme [Luteimonas sp. FCS-9]KLJ01915.1 hypothetical protein WQ56_03315 [Luteimonas sp. FCS-9]
MDAAIRFVRALDNLTRTERDWLRALLDMCTDGPAALGDLWQRAWFEARPGAALILQPESGAAYLYADVSQDNQSDHARADTLSAALLLADLVRCGFASAHHTSHTTAGAFRCLGRRFHTPQIALEHGTPRIVLNEAGDYSEVPSEIRSSRGEILFTGHRLDAESAGLLLQYTSGVLAIRPAVQVAWLREALDAGHPAPASFDVDEIAVSPAIASALPASALDPHLDAPAPQAEAPRDSRPAFKDTRRPRRRRGPRWIAVLVACKLSVMFGVAIGVYVDDASEFLDLSRQARADTLRRSTQPMPPQPDTAIRSAPAEVITAPEAWPKPVYEDETHARDTAQVTEAPHTSDGTTLLGTDISQWSGNGTRGARAVFEAVPDLHFAFARVAYGRRLDHEFHTNWQLMGERNLYRGAYVFLRLDEDPIAQVDNAVEALGPASPRDLCLTIDFEELSFNPHHPAHSKPDVRRIVLAALEHARDRLGCMPLLYTNWSMGSTYLDDPQFAQYPLWIADWTDAPAPRLPPPWKTFAFWQRSDRLPASPSPADLDLFPGTHADLVRLVRR